MSRYGEIRLLTGQRAVTAAGTPEKIKEAPEFVENKVITIIITAKYGNAGDIYITNTKDRANASTVGEILPPGASIEYNVRKIGLDAYLNLAEIWIDAATSGDGISYSAFEVV